MQESLILPSFFSKITIFMNAMDWKEALGKAFDIPVNEDNPVADETVQPEEREDAVTQQGKDRLDIILERK